MSSVVENMEKKLEIRVGEPRRKSSEGAISLEGIASVECVTFYQKICQSPSCCLQLK